MHIRSLAVTLGAVSLLALPGFTATFPAHPQTTPEITAADISARDKAISDDVFEGRGPGTASGEAAAQWIADELKRMGIAPGNHGSYFQDVPAANLKLD